MFTKNRSSGVLTNFLFPCSTLSPLPLLNSSIFFLLGIAFSAGIIKYGSIETEDGKIVPDKRLQAFARLIHYQKWLQ